MNSEARQIDGCLQGGDAVAVSKIELLKQQTLGLTANELVDLAAYLLDHAKRRRQPTSVARQVDVPDSERRAEYEWLRLHRGEYPGQYVAVLGDRLVAHAETLGELHRLVRESGVKRPLFVRVESPDELPFGGW
jgi:Family of unknown function (DUF5678)